jgi:hypothetical protein
MPFGSKLRMSNICHIDLQHLGKNRVVIIVWTEGFFCNFSLSVPTFYPNQGYPLRFLALTHHRCTTSAMVPSRSHTTAIPLNALKSTSETAFVHYQPSASYSLILGRTQCLPWCSYWHNENQTVTTYFSKLLIP